MTDASATGRRVTVERLRERLRYEPDTGRLFWLDNHGMPNNWRARLAGKEAFTSFDGYGYLHGTVDYIRFKAHRVAFALMMERWPHRGLQIDHVNHIRDDNRWLNLREVSGTGNAQNQSRASNNSSGVTGVSWCKRTLKWRAYIWTDGKTNHLGGFTDKDAAIAARKAADDNYGFHINHGAVKS